MKYATVLQDEVVRRAEEIGFEAFNFNPRGRRHFRWFMPHTYAHEFSVYYVGSQVIGYTINHETTSWKPRAFTLLESVAGKIPPRTSDSHTDHGAELPTGTVGGSVPSTERKLV